MGRRVWCRIAVAVGLAVPLLASPAGAVGPQPEPPTKCAISGLFSFKPELVDAIPPKPNGKPGKDRKVKVTITGLLFNCAHQPEPLPTDPGGGGTLKAKGYLPSRLLSQFDTPIANTIDRLRFKWFDEAGKRIGVSKGVPVPAMTWTVTSATTASLQATFSVNSNTFPASSFAVDVTYPEPLPGLVSSIGFDSEDFDVTGP